MEELRSSNQALQERLDSMHKGGNSLSPAAAAAGNDIKSFFKRKNYGFPYSSLKKRLVTPLPSKIIKMKLFI